MEMGFFDRFKNLRKKKEEVERTDEKGSKSPNKLISFLRSLINPKIPIFFAICFVLFWWISRPFWDQLNDGVSSVVSEFAPNWGGLRLLPYLILGVVALSFASLLSEMPMKSSVLTIGFFIFLGGLTNFLLPTFALSPGGKLQPYFSTLTCSLRHLTNPIVCQGILASTEPKAEQSKSKIIDLNFGFGEKTGLPDQVYFDKIYRTSVIVENLDKDKVVKDLTINAFIENDKGERINLVPNICGSASPCRLASKETIIVAGQEKVNFKKGSFVDVKVEASYPREVKGSYGFFIYQSLYEVKKTSPTSGDGPLLVTVYTSPESGVFDKLPDQISLIGKLTNKGKGKAFVNEIAFKKEFAFPGLVLSGDCQTDDGLKFGEDSPLILNPSIELNQKKKETGINCLFDVLKDKISKPSVILDVFVEYLYVEGVFERIQIL